MTQAVATRRAAIAFSASDRSAAAPARHVAPKQRRWLMSAIKAADAACDVPLPYQRDSRPQRQR